MTKMILVSAIAAVSAAGAVAEGTYFEVQGGLVAAPDLDYVFTSDELGPVTRVDGAFDTDLGFFAGAAVGYDFSGPLRIEGEVGYRELDADPVASIGGIVDLPDLNSWALMANGYYDVSMNGSVTPYLGGGLGVAIMPDFLDGSDESAFAFQLMLGLDYALTETQSLGVEYRYFHADDLSADVSGTTRTRTLDTELQASNFVVSWRFSFN